MPESANDPKEAKGPFRRDALGYVPEGHDGFCCGGAHRIKDGA